MDGNNTFFVIPSGYLDELDFTVQGPTWPQPPTPALALTPLQTRDLTVQGPPSLLVTSGGHHLRPVQTCSLQDPPPLPTGADIWWISKNSQWKWSVHIRLECFLVDILVHTDLQISLFSPRTFQPPPDMPSTVPSLSPPHLPPPTHTE